MNFTVSIDDQVTLPALVAAQKPSSQCPYTAETYCAWLDEAEKGLADITAGRSSDARASILAIQARRRALQNKPKLVSDI